MVFCLFCMLLCSAVLFVKHVVIAETQRMGNSHLRKVSVSESNVLLDEEVLTDPKIQALLLTVLVRIIVPESHSCSHRTDILSKVWTHASSHLLLTSIPSIPFNQNQFHVVCFDLAAIPLTYLTFFSLFVVLRHPKLHPCPLCHSPFCVVVVSAWCYHNVYMRAAKGNSLFHSFFYCTSVAGTWQRCTTQRSKGSYHCPCATLGVLCCSALAS